MEIDHFLGVVYSFPAMAFLKAEFLMNQIEMLHQGCGCIAIYVKKSDVDKATEVFNECTRKIVSDQPLFQLAAEFLPQPVNIDHFLGAVFSYSAMEFLKARFMEAGLIMAPDGSGVMGFSIHVRSCDVEKATELFNECSTRIVSDYPIFELAHILEARHRTEESPEP